MGVFTDIVNVIVNVNGEKSGKTLKELKKDSRQLKRELDNLVPGTEEFIKKMEELKRVEAQLRRVQNEIRGVGGAFSKIKDEIRQFGILAMSYMGFEFITDSVKNIISKNAQLSDELADIQKTTGMSQQEVERLNKHLSKIDTRTATSELRKIAAVAGQLGIASADVLAFTKATDKLVVALGDEFAGGAEEVTKNIGALRNIFSDVKSAKIDEDMLKIGNALNELGASGSATAPVVTDFASRIGGIAIPLGLSSAQVLALSATMQELNISTEVGGTAVGKILQKMTTNVKDFAEVANVDVTQFAELVNTDLYGAFLKVAEGAKNSGTSATKLGNMLEGLGLSGAGASQVFLKLGSNTELLSQKLDISAKSLKSTDSVMGEFNVKNETFAAKIEKIGRKMADAFSNSAVAKGLENTVDWIDKLLEQPLEEKIREEKDEFVKMYAQLLNNNLAHKDRVGLINDLQSTYPQYLKNINAETVGNKELFKALDKVNNMLVNKLLLVEYEEQLNSEAEKAKDKLADKVNIETRMLEKSLLIHEKYGYVLKENVTPVEQFTAAQDYLQKYLADQKARGSWKTHFGWMQQANQLYVDGTRLLPMYALAVGDNQIAVENLNKALTQFDTKKTLLGLNEVVDELTTGAKTPEERLKEIDTLLSTLDKRYQDQIALSDNTDASFKKIEQEKAAEKKRLLEEREKVFNEIAKAGADTGVGIVESGEAKKLERLNQSIADAAEALRLSQLNERDRAVEAVNIKYNKLQTEAKGHSEQLKEIEALRNAEILALNKKFADEDAKIEQDRIRKREELSEQVYGMLLSDRDRELYEATQRHQLKNEELAAAGLDASLLYEQQQAEILAIIQKWNKKEVEENKKKNADILASDQQALNDKLANIDAQASVASSLASAFTSMFDALGNESADYVRFQKRLALIQIGVDTAAAIAKLVVMSSSNPANAVTGGLAGIAQYASGFALIMGNIAKARAIWEESGEVPEYRFGGILPGPSHEQGGLGVYNGRRKVAEIEGYEAMIPADTTAANPGIINALLSARGRSITALTSVPAPVSYSTAAKAVRFGREQSTGTPEFAQGVSTSGRSSASGDELLKAVTLLNQLLGNGIQAKLVYDSYSRDLDSISMAKSSAVIGSRKG